MKLVTSDEMKNAEEKTFKEFCVPSVILMENAARGFFDALKREYGSFFGKNIFVFCGKGNNGGDGFAIARFLHNAGANVTVLRLCEEDKIKGDSLTNYEIIKKMNICIKDSLEEFTPCDIIIDAIFGIGFYGQASGIEKKAIELINKSGAYVASVDVPSGINSSNGQVEGRAVFADFVVTFGFYKTGLCLYSAKEHAKKVILCDISIPKEIKDSLVTESYLLDDKVLDFLPKRKANSHKGSFGRVLCIAGSKRFTGAAYLCATSAQKCGAGLVTCATFQEVYDILASKFTEVMTLALPENVKSALQMVNDFQKDAILIGCGMGRSKFAEDIILDTIEKADVPIVIDADGLNALCTRLEILKKRKYPTVLTPHIAEFARLLGTTNEEVLNNRLDLASAFSREYNAIVVLKSADTIIALPDGKNYICADANSGLAKGGSGDVLAGICVSLIAQGLSASYASCVGVYLHSRAGFYAKEDLGEYFMTASDIIKYLPKAFGEKDN